MRVVNYTELRLNLKRWLDIVVNDVEELVIKRKNNKDLVLISLDEYNSLKETQYLLTGKNRDHLIQSIKEAEAGKTIQKDLLDEWGSSGQNPLGPTIYTGKKPIERFWKESMNLLKFAYERHLRVSENPNHWNMTWKDFGLGE